jgi:hypothetical protein
MVDYLKFGEVPLDKAIFKMLLKHKLARSTELVEVLCSFLEQNQHKTNMAMKAGAPPPQHNILVQLV